MTSKVIRVANVTCSVAKQQWSVAKVPWWWLIVTAIFCTGQKVVRVLGSVAKELLIFLVGCYGVVVGC